MQDILFQTDAWVFSYRVAGILIHQDQLFLQKPASGDGFALPGGHVAFGEANAETLVREFKEETGADILVGDLAWVGEIFFLWGDKPCHQICLYYQVSLIDKHQIPLAGSFFGSEQIDGRASGLEFHWVPLADLDRIEVYPTDTAALLGKLGQGVQHFIDREA